MSNHIISLVYKRDLKSLARKSVMLLMADKASDDGSGIWASKQTMADELCVSRQTIVNAIHSLMADDLLAEVGKKKCANGHTIEYQINVGAVKAVAKVNCHSDDPPNSLRGGVGGPPNLLEGTPLTVRGDPPNSFTQTLLEPSLNHKNPPTPQGGKSEILCPDDVDAEVWSDFIKHRASKKAPVTATVLKRLRAEADAADWDLEEALIETMSRGWQSFKASWISDKATSRDREPEFLGPC